MFSDYGCSDDESRKKRSVEDDLGTKMPCSLCIQLQIRRRSILFQANVKYPNKPFSTTGNKAKKQRGKDCFAVLPTIAGNS